MRPTDAWEPPARDSDYLQPPPAQCLSTHVASSSPACRAACFIYVFFFFLFLLACLLGVCFFPFRAGWQRPGSKISGIIYPGFTKPAPRPAARPSTRTPASYPPLCLCIRGLGANCGFYFFCGGWGDYFRATWFMGATETWMIGRPLFLILWLARIWGLKIWHYHEIDYWQGEGRIRKRLVWGIK